MNTFTEEQSVHVALQQVETFGLDDMAKVAAAVSAGELLVAHTVMPLEEDISARRIYDALDSHLHQASLKRSLGSNAFKGYPGHVKPMHTDDISIKGMINVHYTQIPKNHSDVSFEAVFLQGPIIDDKTGITGKIKNAIYDHTREFIDLPEDIAQQTQAALHVDGGPGSVLLFGNSAHQFKTTRGDRNSRAMYYVPYNFVKGQYAYTYRD